MRSRRPFRSERFGPFRGRDQEVGTLRALLDGRAPIVTVTGLPGVGKTRLVAHVVGDGAVWVDASEIGDAASLDLLVERSAVDIGQDGRRAGGPVTVVLDGLDRPDLALPLAEFVDDHPALRVVVTSRTHIRLRGAPSLRLTPFELPTRSASLVAEPDRWPAVQCFLDHAAIADPGFRVTQDTATSVLDLLKSTGGLPLAIELATTWLGALPVSALSWALAHPGQLSERSIADLDPSQQNLGRTLHLAVAHIPAGARDLAQAIAEFHGPAPLGALAAVLDTDVTLDTLGELLESNLVWTADLGGSPHVAMLPLVAGELRSRRTDEGHRARYLAWLTDTIATHADRLNRPTHASAAAALAPIVDGLPDLREVYPVGDERIAEVTLALLPYWRQRSQYREAGRRVEAALAATDDDHPLAPWLAVALARAHRDRIDVATGARIALRVATDPRLPDVVRAVATNELALLGDMGDVTVDGELLDLAAHVAATRPPDVPACVRRWVADVSIAKPMVLGRALQARGDVAAASALAEAVLGGLTADDGLIAWCAALDEVITVRRMSGDTAGTLDALEQLTELTRSFGERSAWHLFSRVRRATVLVEHHRHSEARAEALDLLAAVEQQEAPVFIEQSLRSLGLVLAEVGDVTTARDTLRRSLAIGEFMGEPFRTLHVVLAVALAADPVGPDRGTRARLVAAALATDPEALEFWTGPWRERAASLDLDVDAPDTLADAVALAASVLDAAPAAAPAPGLPVVTNREREVLAMLGEGFTDKEIAARLVVSVRTAEAHVAAILRKLAVANRREAGAVARRSGLVAPSEHTGG